MLCYHCMKEKGDAVVCPFCGKKAITNAALHYLPAGTVIGGRYLLGYVLGEGGFGITYIGLDQTLDVPVAVKEYYPFSFANRTYTVGNAVSVNSDSNSGSFEKGKIRFLSEAKTIARFRKEPGIVNVSDFIEENNTAYIVMEFLEGIDLRHYLKENGVMTVEQTLSLMLPVIESLGKIHKEGVIHRDISPDNLMYMGNHTLKLMDFGAARDYAEDNRSMSVMLKQGYAPAEQYRRNGQQGPWTDVYAICATIYRCITGVVPVDSIDRVFSDTLKKPSELGVQISPAVENVLMYGLAIQSQDRCPDMQTLSKLLKEAQSGGNITPSPKPSEDITVAADSPEPPERPQIIAEPDWLFKDKKEPPAGNAKPSRAPIIAAVAVLLTALIVILIVIKPFGSKNATGKDSSAASSAQSDGDQNSSGHPDLKDYEFTETGVGADNFRAATAYLYNYIDSTAYYFDLSSETISSSKTVSDDNCYIIRDGSSYDDYETTLKHYDDPRTDLGDQITVKDSTLTLTQTTISDLLADGWEYNGSQKPQANHSVVQTVHFVKNGTYIGGYIDSTGDDPESAPFSWFDIAVNDRGKSSNEFAFKGLVPSDDLEAAVQKLGTPNKIHIITLSDGAFIYFYYYTDNKKHNIFINFKYSTDSDSVQIHSVNFMHRN